MTGTIAEIDAGPIACEPSLFHYLHRSVATYPDNAAVIVAHQPGDHMSSLLDKTDANHLSGMPQSYLSWTYSDLQHASLKVVASLQKAGIAQGASIVTLIPNGIEWALLFWSSILGKMGQSSLDFNALSPERAVELRAMLTSLQPDMIVVSDATGAFFVDEALKSMSKQPRLKLTLKEPDSDTVQPATWTTLLTLASSAVDVHAASQITQAAFTDDPDRICSCLFTSGTTTGKPKGCPRTVRMTLHTTKTQHWGGFQGPKARNAFITQNFRVIAPAMALGSWMHGSAIVMPGPGFSPPAILHAVETHKISFLLFVPAMLHAITAHPDFGKTDKASLRTVFLGADMITKDIYLKAVRAFPHCEVVLGHGMTEGGGAFRWPLLGKIGEQALPWYAGIGPLGKVEAGTRLRIADESNRPLERNQMGELHFCSNGFIKRYLDGVKPEDFYVDSEGSWFKTGDTGLIDDQGWVYILGRKKDIIKRAGVTIQPAAVESELDSYLGCQTCVLGVKHETLGQEPFVVVRDLKGKSREEIKKFVLDTFGADSSLGGVATLADLGLADFPVNATGKIMKLDLEKPVAAFLNISNVQ